MFFFFFSSGAADSFKAAVKAEGTTYEEFAKKVGVSRGTIAKFVSGRPLTEGLLRKVVTGFPREHGKKILLGHLNDEIQRAGMDPKKFQIVEKNSQSYVLENLSRLLTEDSKRLADVVSLMDTWERKSEK